MHWSESTQMFSAACSYTDLTFNSVHLCTSTLSKQTWQTSCQTGVCVCVCVCVCVPPCPETPPGGGICQTSGSCGSSPPLAEDQASPERTEPSWSPDAPSSCRHSTLEFNLAAVSHTHTHTHTHTHWTPHHTQDWKQSGLKGNTSCSWLKPAVSSPNVSTK